MCEVTGHTYVYCGTYNNERVIEGCAEHGGSSQCLLGDECG